MSLSEALSQGLSVTVTGISIVFGVLIILMVVMMLMKLIFYRPEPKAEKAVPAPKATAKAADEAMDEGELIAVLTAAIAASLNTSTYQLNIKSYRRIQTTSPAWNKAGLKDVIDARF